MKLAGKLLVLSSVIVLSACAQSAQDVQSVYISPLQYKDLSCDEIASEAQRISIRSAQLTGAQNRQATEDAVATTVAVVAFWPALFLVEGDNETAAELSRLKGEFQALQQAAERKRCDLKFETRQKRAS